MRYVFNTEGDNEILGTFVRVDEDTVVYQEENGRPFKFAPADCVTVREVTYREVRSEVERLAKRLATDGGGDLTGLNSIVAVAAQAIAYARVMGAALTTDNAMREVYRQANDGRYVGARTHSRQFEETPV